MNWAASYLVKQAVGPMVGGATTGALKPGLGPRVELQGGSVTPQPTSSLQNSGSPIHGYRRMGPPGGTPNAMEGFGGDVWDTVKGIGLNALMYWGMGKMMGGGTPAAGGPTPPGAPGKPGVPGRPGVPGPTGTVGRGVQTAGRVGTQTAGRVGTQTVGRVGTQIAGRVGAQTAGRVGAQAVGRGLVTGLSRAAPLLTTPLALGAIAAAGLVGGGAYLGQQQQNALVERQIAKGILKRGPQGQLIAVR